eukprot:jgi/Bigna1/79872/fgenesh1_pg.66_\
MTPTSPQQKEGSNIDKEKEENVQDHPFAEWYQKELKNPFSISEEVVTTPGAFVAFLREQVGMPLRSSLDLLQKLNTLKPEDRSRQISSKLRKHFSVENQRHFLRDKLKRAYTATPATVFSLSNFLSQSVSVMADIKSGKRKPPIGSRSRAKRQRQSSSSLEKKKQVQAAQAAQAADTATISSSSATTAAATTTTVKSATSPVPNGADPDKKAPSDAQKEPVSTNPESHGENNVPAEKVTSDAQKEPASANPESNGENNVPAENATESDPQTKQPTSSVILSTTATEPPAKTQAPLSEPHASGAVMSSTECNEK